MSRKYGIVRKDGIILTQIVEKRTFLLHLLSSSTRSVDPKVPSSVTTPRN